MKRQDINNINQLLTEQHIKVNRGECVYMIHVSLANRSYIVNIFTGVSTPEQPDQIRAYGMHRSFGNNSSFHANFQFVQPLQKIVEYRGRKTITNPTDPDTWLNEMYKLLDLYMSEHKTNPVNNPYPAYLKKDKQALTDLVEKYKPIPDRWMSVSYPGNKEFFLLGFGKTEEHAKASKELSNAVGDEDLLGIKQLFDNL